MYTNKITRQRRLFYNKRAASFDDYVAAVVVAAAVVDHKVSAIGNANVVIRGRYRLFRRLCRCRLCRCCYGDAF